MRSGESVDPFGVSLVLVILGACQSGWTWRSERHQVACLLAWSYVKVAPFDSALRRSTPPLGRRRITPRPNPIPQIFMPRVTVRASPDEFTFSTENALVSVAPVVWYNRSGQAYAFGIDHALPPEIRRLDLFPPGQNTGPVESLIAPLQQFFVYHFECVARLADAPWWRLILRRSPDVTFSEVRDFDGRVQGDPRALLTRACRAAGARRVDFL